MQYTICVCENKECNKTFQRLSKELKRCIKKGFSITCSRHCGAVIRNQKNPSKGNYEYIKGFTRQDNYSSFRYYINKAKARIQYGPTNLTVEYLKDLWDSQNGICPYTGKKMELPINTQRHNIKGSPIKASLDRINSFIGYVQGNVEFVCLSVNLAKNHFTREQMIEFFKLNK